MYQQLLYIVSTKKDSLNPTQKEIFVIALEAWNNITGDAPLDTPYEKWQRQEPIEEMNIFFENYATIASNPNLAGQKYPTWGF